jgi:hypothetical protein
MFAQALRMVRALPANVQDALIVRLESVRDISREFGYGVADEMGVLLSEFVSARGRSWK